MDQNDENPVQSDGPSGDLALQRYTSSLARVSFCLNFLVKNILATSALQGKHGRSLQPRPFISRGARVMPLPTRLRWLSVMLVRDIPRRALPALELPDDGVKPSGTGCIDCMTAVCQATGEF